MKKNLIPMLLVLCLLVSLLLAGCGGGETKETEAATKPAQFLDTDKDFSRLRTPGSQEEAYDYLLFFQPEEDEIGRAHV